MKTKRKFLGKFHIDLLMLLIFWLIMHCAGWYSNGGKDFLSSQLLYLTLSITFLLLLFLSSTGSDKEYLVGLPLINSYKETPFGIEVTPGGFNLLMRLFYFVMALILMFLAFFKDGWENSSLLEILMIIVFAFILLFLVVKYFQNRNDYISIDQYSISWFDNQNKNVLKVDLKSIVDFKVQKVEFKKEKYTQKIILNTSDISYTIDLEEVSMLQFSNEIMNQLEVSLKFVNAKGNT